MQSSASRGELYAYDRETKRYLRLTHTDHKVVGFVRAAAGNEVTVLGFDKVDHPKVETEASLFAAPWLQIYDATEWKAVGTKIALPAAREIAVGYAAGDQLLVAVDGTVSSIDRTTGKLTKVATALPAPRIVRDARRGPPRAAARGRRGGVEWRPADDAELQDRGRRHRSRSPSRARPAQASIAVAPGGARVAFATAVDPCAKDTAPSLYVADAKTARAQAPAHRAEPVRDPLARREPARLRGRRRSDPAVGRRRSVARSRASTTRPASRSTCCRSPPAPLCKQAPPTVEPAGAGSGDDRCLPRKARGPITAPQ